MEDIVEAAAPEVSQSAAEPAGRPDLSTSESPMQSDGFSVPDEYKEKGWIKQVQSVDDLWKTADSLQSLKGKKDFGLPADNASDEEWAAFFEKTRPESVDSYELHEEGAEFNEDFEGVIKSIFHEVGVTPKQAEAIASKFNEFSVEMQSNNLSHDDGDFNRISAETFGSSENITKAFESAKTLLNDTASQEEKEILNGADNKTLIALASVLNKTHNKYGMEGRQVANVANAQVGKSPDDIRTDAKQLMIQRDKLPNHRKTMNDPEFKALSNKIDQSYQQI